MTALSFKRRFAPPIIARTKVHTIRAPRRRPIIPGDTLHLFTGMRTRQCRRIGEAECISISSVRLYLFLDMVVVAGDARIIGTPALNAFAVCDGFSDWDELKAFWRREHGDVAEFFGSIIFWGDTFRAASDAPR